MARIHIKNLGPIQDVEFDIKKFNVLSVSKQLEKALYARQFIFFVCLKITL